MIRHTLTEGWLLIRQRGLIGVTLSCALAVPVCLAGVTLTVGTWLGPIADLSEQQAVVAVLLHPRMSAEQQQRWLDDTRKAHPEWGVETVSPGQLLDRLSHWFPYLNDLFDGEDDDLLPRLVEIATADPDSVAGLVESSAIIAVGPRSSLNRILSRAAERVAILLLVLSAVLLGSAALLTAIWVHLELYRHADEITIMRLIGATEGAIRGPFLIAVVSPGVLAALLATAGTLILSRLLSQAAGALGLPPIATSPAALAVEISLACLLPLAAALITLRRHSARDLD